MHKWLQCLHSSIAGFLRLGGTCFRCLAQEADGNENEETRYFVLSLTTLLLWLKWILISSMRSLSFLFPLLLPNTDGAMYYEDSSLLHK